MSIIAVLAGAICAEEKRSKAHLANQTICIMHKHGRSQRHDFEWLRCLTPEFAVDGNNIQILETPADFHSKLVQEACAAKKRVVLAALYLGTGSLEKELLDAVQKVASDSGNEVKIDILIDFVRGSRGKENSVEMLKPLLNQYGESNNLKISLYHTPNLRGLLKKFLPPRWNETIGVAHLKAFIFDDNFVISGANLSHDYFTNRQDRYMAFHNCPQLADYFHSIVETIGQFSFTLQPDGSVEMPPEWPHHPYNGVYRDFASSAQRSIKDLVYSFFPHDLKNIYSMSDGYFINNEKGILYNIRTSVSTLFSTFFSSSSFKQASINEMADDSLTEILSSQYLDPPASCKAGVDTWIYPTIQMGLFGVRQDEYVTATLLRSLPAGSNVSFTTGYFNVTDKYCDIMIESTAGYEILLSSPEANGFYESRGFGKHIPEVYIHLCKNFHRKVVNSNREHDFSLLEYIRKGWTFHGKGMWCYLPGEGLPSLTLIGSPNFGLRSVDRDLEAQIVLVTKNELLRRKLHKERNNIAQHTSPITAVTFERPRYFVPRWVALATHFIKRFF